MAQVLEELRELGKRVEKTVIACGAALPLNEADSIRITHRTATGQLEELALPATTTQEVVQLASACTPATFGLGSEDVLDKTYRDAVTLDPANFTTTFLLSEHPQILSEVEAVLVPSKESDGSPLICARLYKLNVYGPGGFFKAHRDTPRGGGKMFGSLVVCLPTQFQGGDLAVRSEDGFEQRFEWGPTAASSIQWCAFYSDCEHEVLPVTSGYRVTLTYLLETESALSTADAAFVHPVSSVEMKLRHALEDPTFAPNGAKLGFGLKHAYAVGRDGDVPTLKGADRALKDTIDRLDLTYVFVPVYRDDRDEGDVQVVSTQSRWGRPPYELREFTFDDESESLDGESDNENDEEGSSEDYFVKGDGRTDLYAGTWVAYHDGGDTYNDNEVCGGRIDHEALDLRKLQRVLWIAKPVEFPLQKDCVTYGNEAVLSTYYAAASFLVWVPPAAKRQRRASARDRFWMDGGRAARW